MINDVDFDGNTPFHDAVESSGHFTAVKMRLNAILKFGGVANTLNHRGQNALHKVAGYKGVAERIDFLLQERLGLDLHAQDNEGIMPIHIAAATSEVNTWKFVQAGADIKAQANDGRSPLHFAAGVAQSNVVGLLCKLYTEKSLPVDQRDETGRTALHYAICSGNSECAYYLLEAGANPNVKDKEGLKPLHAAAEHRIGTASQETPQIRRSTTLAGRTTREGETDSIYGYEKGMPIS
jgi:ankyrin repeat protein